MDTVEKKSAVEEVQPSGDVEVEKSPKETTTATDISVENGEKSYYSKQSVWLMVLFSGLAIGSDG